MVQGHPEEAINIFIELDINPAKIISLFPPAISGRLAQPQTKWIQLFGGEAPKDNLTEKLLHDTEVTAEPGDVTAIVDEEHPDPEAKSKEEPPTKGPNHSESKQFWRHENSSCL